MKSRILTAMVLTLAVVLPVVRANATSQASVDVTKSMNEAKVTAYQLSETADRLHSITQSGGHSWQSHSWYLESARADVNQLGKMLSELEDLRLNATQTQQLAIDRMRPQLSRLPMH